MRRSTTWILLGLCAWMIPTMPAAQSAQDEILRRQVPRSGEILVTVNGRRVVFPDVRPQMFGSRVMVPLRGVFEMMNADVRWMAQERQVVARRGNRTVVLTIGSAKAQIDDADVVMDAQPVIYENRTLVPLRFVAESLRAGVVWRPEERTVVITLHGIEAPFFPDPPRLTSFANFAPKGATNRKTSRALPAS